MQQKFLNFVIQPLKGILEVALLKTKVRTERKVHKELQSSIKKP